MLATSLPSTTGGPAVATSPAITVAAVDFDRLQQLVASAAGPTAEQLEGELARARVVPAGELAPDVVAMDRDVTYEDLTAGSRRTVRVVYPRDAEPTRGRVSVLAPLGAALLGLRVGQEIDWPMPRGVHRVRVVAVAPPAT